MPIKDDLEKDVKAIANMTWSSRDGQVVPSTDNVALVDGAVNLEATLLYADLADSTEMAMYDKKMTGKVYKAFLACASRIIKDEGGQIRSFDGDRVMGV